MEQIYFPRLWTVRLWQLKHIKAPMYGRDFLKPFPMGALNWTAFWTTSLLRSSVKSVKEMETDISEGYDRSLKKKKKLIIHWYRYVELYFFSLSINLPAASKALTFFNCLFFINARLSWRCFWFYNTYSAALKQQSSSPLVRVFLPGNSCCKILSSKQRKQMHSWGPRCGWVIFKFSCEFTWLMAACLEVLVPDQWRHLCSYAER